MPERGRQRRARTARADARQDVGTAYNQLARMEAERGALLASAIQAAERHRAAQDEARRSAEALTEVLSRLIDLGMRPADVAATLDVSPEDLRRLLDERQR